MINVNNVKINPVLLKELKVKMRGWKTAFLIAGYNIVLALLMLFILRMIMHDYTGNMRSENILQAYVFMIVMQFGLVTLVAPALTAGAISGEREKQTLDILMSTTMKPSSIIIGKLLSSLSLMILLIFSSIPIFSIIFLYGVIGLRELLQVFGFYIILAITLGSIGIFFSTFIKKSTASNVLSYAVIVFLYLGTLFITIFYVEIVYRRMNYYSYDKTFWPLYFNPIAGLISVVASQLGQGGQVLPGLYLSGKRWGLHMWQINAIVSMVISIMLLWLSAWRLNPVRGRLFFRRRAKRK